MLSNQHTRALTRIQFDAKSGFDRYCRKLWLFLVLLVQRRG